MPSNTGSSIPRATSRSTVSGCERMRPDIVDAVKLRRLLWEVFLNDLKQFRTLTKSDQESWIGWVLGDTDSGHVAPAFSFRTTAVVAGYDAAALRDEMLDRLRRWYRMSQQRDSDYGRADQPLPGKTGNGHADSRNLPTHGNASLNRMNASLLLNP